MRVAQRERPQVVPLPLVPFLREVWAPSLIGSYPELRSLMFRGARREFLVRAADGCWLAPIDHQSGSTHFSVNPRLVPEGHRGAVDYYVALFADIDDWNLSAPLVAKLAATGISPSAEVGSGSEGHRHLYYFMSEPEIVTLGEPVARRLCAALSSDAVFYPNICARIPGTYNYKDPARPKPVRLLEMSGRRYGLRDIDAALDAAGFSMAPMLPVVAAVRRARRPAQAAPDVDARRLKAIWEVLPDWCRSLVERGKSPGDRYDSRSEADAAVIRILVDAGAEDDDIVSIFASHPDGIGERYAERGDYYLDRTIEFIRRNSPTESWATVDDVKSRGPGSRVALDLSIYYGKFQGEKFQHGIESTCTAWPFLFRSAGLAPPPSGAAGEAHALWDRDLRVEVQEIVYCGARRLQVKRFLPQIPELEVK